MSRHNRGGGNNSCLRKMASAKKAGSGVLERAVNRRRSSKHKEGPIGIYSFNKHKRFLEVQVVSYKMSSALPAR